MTTHWQSLGGPAAQRIPRALKPWLLDSHSMTQRLKQHLPELKVTVLAEGWHPKKNMWLREVTLGPPQSPWIVAQCGIPKRTCEHSQYALTQLGDTPLGQFLYTKPPIVRRDLRVATLSSDDPLFHWANGHNHHPATELWARRSALHWQAQDPIIVTEVFLPTCHEHADHPC